MKIRQIATFAIVAAAIVGTVWWLNAPSGGERYSAAGSGNATAERGAAMVEVQVPDTLSGQAQIGQRGFEGLCAQCHGENAAGRQGISSNRNSYRPWSRRFVMGPNDRMPAIH